MSAPATLTECVACGSSRWGPESDWHGYELARCSECGIIFTVNPDYSRERYRGAYEKSYVPPLSGADIDVYHRHARRLELELRSFWRPAPRLRQAERVALAWLRKALPSAARVVDCGCGTGQFLRALTNAGFLATGFEISESLTSRLRAQGLDARVGAAPDFPWYETPPAAITLFEVLEHLAKPSIEIGGLRARFPEAAVLASVPAPRRVDVALGRANIAVDSPPNHFLRWTPQALEAFFRRLGYAKVQVCVPPPMGSEVLPGISQLLAKARRTATRPRSPSSTGDCDGETGIRVRLAATAAVTVHRAYEGVRDIAGAGRARSFARSGISSSSMLVIATQ